jgi:hypothetical protein
VFGWSIARILDHRTSTQRKQDLNQAQKLNGYTINALRARIVEIGAGTPPIEPPEDDMPGFLPLEQGMGMGDLADRIPDVAWLQRELNKSPKVNPKLEQDGKYGSGTSAGAKQFLGGRTSDGSSVGGNHWGYILDTNQAQAIAAGGGGGGDLKPHTHSGGKTGGVT